MWCLQSFGSANQSTIKHLTKPEQWQGWYQNPRQTLSDYIISVRQPNLQWSFKIITHSETSQCLQDTAVQILGKTHLHTSAWDGVLCLKQVMKTTNGQSSGCIMTPAAWAQLTWKDVGHRPCEHCTQQPAILFLLFLQKMHFCGQETRDYWLVLGFTTHQGLANSLS